MKLKVLTHICFLLPFAITVFNFQVIVTKTVSFVLAQLIAYGNLALIFLGIALIMKKRGSFSSTAKLWIIFYIMYFVIAMVASVIHYNPAVILENIIPLLYVIGFYIYLSVPENRKVFKITAIWAFTFSVFLGIHFYNTNFDLDRGGFYAYIDRAGGVYGDANNAALAAIIAFILVYKLYNPKTLLFKGIKIIFLAIILNGLFITFSNTGFMVFIVCFVSINYKFFKGLRLVLGVALIPVLWVIMANLNTITADMNLVGQQRDKINNLVNIATFNTDKVDDSGRNELVTNLLHNYVYKNPIFGNGINFAASQRGHNTIIGVWADAGIFALLFFLFMLLRYFIQAFRSPPEIRFFVLPILLTMCIFMLSLQSVINQPYLMAMFIYLGYLIDFKDVSEVSKEELTPAIE
ncbi:hypothetical protein [Winogradskyella tangerina]|uniref:hypothetical protein n=1 Tax=Winogradskyella tangerina TaxID=2023240 RepID=UPI000DBE1E69|nr:hypothetical protein [Winogradskyella tangerina]